MLNSRMDEALSHTIAERERQLELLRQTLTEHERTAETLRQSFEQHERMLAILRRTVEEQERTLTSERESLKRHESEVELLQQQISDQENLSSYKLALALSLSNLSYDALVIIDKNMKIIAINEVAEELFGRKRPIGEHIVDVSNKPELASFIEDSLINQESLEEQIEINKRMFKVRVMVIHRDNFSFIGLAMQDITSLVRLARARRDMVANISHELRHPITNIKLIIEGLFHDQDKPKRKPSVSALKAIAREVDSMVWMVEGMHDLSRIESGEAILRMIEFPLIGLVNDVRESMIDQSDEKGITVETDIPDDLSVLADHDLSHRVLVNLLHNAIKWSPPNQPVTISAVDDGDQVMVSISDHGPGVPEAHRERIFERFYQIDPARSHSESGGGTGLGLAISKHIVEAHEGRIWVEETPGGGAKFCFTLPNASILH